MRLSSMIIAALLYLGLFPGWGQGAEITPFYTFNQSPVVQIFGLPPAGDARLLKGGHLSALLAADIANNFAVDSNAGENIILDGESYRYTLALRYGITDRLEFGIDVPYVGQGGGCLDGFIVGWHRFFGLPQGGHTEAPENRLLYTYNNGARKELLADDSDFNLGDLRLSGGFQLYDDGERYPRCVALRAEFKAPTGNSSRLHGSGSTDFALWITASDDYPLPEPWGHFALFASVGGMAMTDGNVLRERQRNVAGFGTFGFGWSPADWIAFKTQLSGHTPFYRSSLRELGSDVLQLVMGGTLAFSPTTALDIGVSEDVVIRTSPDVAFHLALKRLF